MEGTATENWESLTTLRDAKSGLALINAEESLGLIKYTEGADIEKHFTAMHEAWSKANTQGAGIDDKKFRIYVLKSMPKSWSILTGSLFTETTSAVIITCLTMHAMLTATTMDISAAKNTQALSVQARTFVTECLVTFQAKAITYEQDHLKVSFASSYLKDGAMDYFRLQLTYNPQHPMFTNWEGFVHELGSRFRIPNSRVEAENNLLRLKMKEWEKFTTFIIKKALPPRILNVLAIAPSPETYEGYRGLVTQIDWRYWENRVENPEAYKPLWANNANASNTSTRPLMGPSAGPAHRTTPETTKDNRNARLNAESHDPDPDTGKEGKAQDQEIAWDDEEALQANNFGFKKSTCPWVKITEDVKQQRIRDKTCILCGNAVIRTLPGWSPTHHYDHYKRLSDVCDYADSSPTNVIGSNRPTLLSVCLTNGATDNFMDSDMVTSRGLHLEELNPLVNLCLFDGELSALGKITHYTTNDVKFSDGTTQRIRFLLTKLHETATIVLGLSWLKEVYSCINWKDLCITLRQGSNGKIEGSLPDLRRKNEVAPTTTDTGAQRLPLRSAHSFTIEVQLKGSPTRLQALIDSGAAGNFITQSLCTKPEPLVNPMTLQLFNGNPSGGGAISHHSPKMIKLENGLEYKVDLLITQLHPATPLVLGLPWLQKANPDIDWREMSMTMEQGAGLAAISLSQKTQWGTVTLEEEEDVEAPKPANLLSEKTTSPQGPLGQRERSERHPQRHHEGGR
ncbi:hypothetical protein D9615_007778 [Tricholomella constricta]|uniref:Uncharacterized protein n=1 Tax=Tricholomella constricta TaxID=117010 RepID=A0A8H5H476_9AGAR|nr:hypothetical protein D9615_007778 [Tricholomella constricta]